MLKVCIIIPAFNEEKTIIAALNSLALQTYDQRDLQIVVVANACIDNTAHLVRDIDMPIHLIETPLQGISLAKNLGYEYAKKIKPALYVFMDADCIAQENLIEILVNKIEQGFEGGKAAVVGASDDDSRAARMFCRLHKLIHPLFMKLPGLDSGQGALTFLCDDLAQRIESAPGELFSVKHTTLEDVELMIRMKKAGKCTFVREVGIYTSMRRFREEGYLKCLFEDIYHGINPIGKTRERWR